MSIRESLSRDMSSSTRVATVDMKLDALVIPFRMSTARRISTRSLAGCSTSTSPSTMACGSFSLRRPALDRISGIFIGDRGRNSELNLRTGPGLGPQIKSRSHALSPFPDAS